MPKKAAPKRVPPKFVEDDILDSDSEVDEFNDYVASTRRPAANADEDVSDSDEGASDEDVDEFDAEEGDGVGMYEADDWDAASDAGSDSDLDSAPSDDEDAAKLVS